MGRTPSTPALAPKTKRRRTRGRRERQRQTEADLQIMRIAHGSGDLGTVRRQLLTAAQDKPHERERIDPADALHEALESAVSMMRVACALTADLDTDDLFREDSFGNTIPHEYLRLEGDYRHEVGQLAAIMLKLGIEDRNARAVERYVDIIAAALEAILSDPRMQLTPAQRKLLPEVVESGLRSLEAGKAA